MKQYYIYIVVLICALGAACDSHTIPHFVFIGDSQVALWKTRTAFRGIVSENYGVSGSGIAHLREYAGRFDSLDVVVVCGGNELYHLNTEEDIQQLAEEYTEAVIALGGVRTYVFSIVPRFLQRGIWRSHERVRHVNEVIKEHLLSSGHPNIYYLDVFDKFFDGPDGTLNYEYTVDSVHLSQKGYTILNDALYPYILRVCDRYADMHGPEQLPVEIALN